MKINAKASYEELLEAALQKREAYDRTFSRERGYVLAYPDTSIARNVPGTKEEFTVAKYKDGLGKAFSRIVLYLGPVANEKCEKTSTGRRDHVEHVQLDETESSDSPDDARDDGRGGAQNDGRGNQLNQDYVRGGEPPIPVEMIPDEDESFLETDFL